MNTVLNITLPAPQTTSDKHLQQKQSFISDDHKNDRSDSCGVYIIGSEIQLKNEFNTCADHNSTDTEGSDSECHSIRSMESSPLLEQKIDDISHVLTSISDNEQNSGDDYHCNSEKQILISEVCDQLFDENYNSFNWKLYKGIIYSSLSAIFYSLCSAIVKYLENINPGELAVIRFTGIWLLTLPLVIRNGSNPFGAPKVLHFLILGGLLNAASIFFGFYAFRYLPIADASVIIFSVPVFVSIFACIFLNESCDIFQILCVFLTMLGLTFTTKLPIILNSNKIINSTVQSVIWESTDYSDSQQEFLFNQESYHIYGVVFALISTLFSSSFYIFIRKAKGTDQSIIMFNMGWVSIIETLIITSLIDGFSMPKIPVQWVLIFMLGIFSFCGQILLTRSLQLEQAGPVSVIRASTDIVLSFVWQFWIFNDIPDLWSITGALLVTTCIIIISVRKWVLTLPGQLSFKD